MLHAVHRFEKRRLPREVLLHLGLYARHIVRMHELVPVQHDVLAVGPVTEHGPPAARQRNALGFAIEVPYAVIGGGRNQRIALVHFC